jgi:hypothetical protein
MSGQQIEVTVTIPSLGSAGAAGSLNFAGELVAGDGRKAVVHTSFAGKAAGPYTRRLFIDASAFNTKSL